MAEPRQPAPRFELMPETFPRSARELEADGLRRSGAALLIAVLLLTAWTAWLSLSRVSLVAVSGSARVEAEAHPVEARAGGLVVATHIQLGRQVEAGELLVELDSATERLRLEEERAVERALAAQLAEIGGEIAAHQHALEAMRSARRSALAEALADRRAVETSARLAEGELARSSRLRDQELLSEAELERQRADALGRRQAASGRRIAVGRLGSERSAELAGAGARLAELGRDQERLKGERAASELAIGRLERAVEERRVRAPVAGRIVDVADIRPGEVVEARSSFATVLPAGSLRVVAWFEPHGLVGRVRAGHPASLRLDGFPWTRYGTVRARVRAVALEPRGGRIRVELALARGSIAIPLQHGLTGRVEIEIDRVSPASLVLRTAVGHLFPPGEELPAPAEPR